MKAIVYTSNSGFTEKYAMLLSEMTDLPCFTLKKALSQLKKSDEVIYLGWICAGSIKGYKKAEKAFTVIAVGEVGMAPYDEKFEKEAVQKFSIEPGKVFYLQGGYDKTKLHGIYKIMMSMMEKFIRKNAEENKNDLQVQEMLEAVEHGKDWVSKDKLSNMMEFLKINI